jgi:mannitol-specific phosphotransferase system IIBC component
MNKVDSDRLLFRSLSHPQILFDEEYLVANSILASEINTIILACEAGMGSSLMSVNALKKKIKKANVQGVKVIHKPARGIPADAKLIIVHKGLANVVRNKAPQAVVVTFNHFFNDPAFDKLVQAFVDGGEIVASGG